MTSSSGDGAVCPNESVVFTCAVNITFLRWTVDPPPDRAVTTGFTQVIFGIDGIGSLPPVGAEGFMFQIAITANDSDSLTSTLTTLTEVSSLNGTTVSCAGTPPESLNIIVAGELNTHTIQIMNKYISNRAFVSSNNSNGG